MTNEELRRQVRRARGAGMSMTVRVADLARLLSDLDSATGRAEAAEAALPRRGKARELGERVEALSSLARYLGAVVEDGVECGSSPVDALKLWGERQGIDVSAEVEVLDRALSVVGA